MTKPPSGRPHRGVHIGCQIRHARALRPVAAPQDRWRTRRRRCPPRPRLVRATLSAARQSGREAYWPAQRPPRCVGAPAARRRGRRRAAVPPPLSVLVGGPSLSSLAGCRVRSPPPCVAMADGYHGLPTPQPTLRDSSARVLVWCKSCHHRADADLQLRAAWRIRGGAFVAPDGGRRPAAWPLGAAPLSMAG